MEHIGDGIGWHLSITQKVMNMNSRWKYQSQQKWSGIQPDYYTSRLNNVFSRLSALVIVIFSGVYEFWRYQDEYGQRFRTGLHVLDCSLRNLMR
ncbi:unnamed protein product [Bursaphelenchus xylophilus]|uniref:(pine wood nematode) hypothetical protein n=1 Tax=Bursaphelenchus xylophilus TaxID=6326 RepID=A0A1I7S7T1_BURXY|nr:unnamed protein product [Bursaphelenchus xylophilus]CAG9086966.1 unnamed protein product [Bursaphelenchus xylophilus]